MTFAEIYQEANTGTARVIEAEKICAVLNLAQEIIWRAYPWRWTIAELAPFWGIPYEQDYGAPFVAVPSDFLELQFANIVRINNWVSTRSPLQIQRGLPKTSYVNRPNSICYVPEKECFRIHPRPPHSFCPPDFLIEGWYKKTPTIVTPATYQSTELPSMSHQRHMWQEAITWAYYVVTKDQQNIDKAYQRAMQAIAQTADAEAVALGNPNIHPSEGIVSPSVASGVAPIIVSW